MLITKEKIKQLFKENGFKFKTNLCELQPAVYKSINAIEREILKELKDKGKLKDLSKTEVRRVTDKIRDLLYLHSDGLTVTEIANQTGINDDSIYPALKLMPDAYIDRWTNKGRQTSAVWCVVVKPENCPKPDLDY